jgi:hypothetical protein
VNRGEGLLRSCDIIDAGDDGPIFLVLVDARERHGAGLSFLAGGDGVFEKFLDDAVAHGRDAHREPFSDAFDDHPRARVRLPRSGGTLDREDGIVEGQDGGFVIPPMSRTADHSAFTFSRNSFSWANPRAMRRSRKGSSVLRGLLALAESDLDVEAGEVPAREEAAEVGGGEGEAGGGEVHQWHPPE